MRKRIGLLLLLAPLLAQARVVGMKIERREPVLGGKTFGAAGAYEKLVGRVSFALDPRHERNLGVIDLDLAPKNPRGEVEFSADFYLLKPVDLAKANGRLLYEVGNRGGKAMLVTFQKAAGSPDPKTPAEFGDGFLMREGYSMLWMGWQWDVPEGRMRMDMPIATDHGASITGLLRGNFILDTRSATAQVADRGHKAYPVADRTSADAFLTVRDSTAGAPLRIARNKWRFVDDNTVALEGGFEPGRIYDVVYRAKDPRVLGTDLTGTRDLISFLRNATDGNPLRGAVKYAYGWGVSQSGRLLRHMLYEGFNEDETGHKVFDGVIDEVGGAGRGSFNHRFGQASRDAEQFFNFLYPVDMFPFTDGPETDPETGETASLLGPADQRGVTPKIFHILSNSEYFNRGGALVHSDPAGKVDVELPATARIYTIASGPHFIGPFPPAPPAPNLAAPLNPLNRNLIVRALLKAMDTWVVEGEAPPASQYPRIADGTLVTSGKAGWPKIPGVLFPPPALVTYRLDFGPKFKQGIVDFEPPHIGKPYAVLVPAVDMDGNARAGIRMPAIEAPIATYSGWNYRAKGTGAENQFSGEAGSIFPFARTKAQRIASGDSRLSMEERYTSREQYVGRAALAAQRLASQRYMLAEDVADAVEFAARQWDWAALPGR